jgi:peroxiredoxin Q/BCP
MGVNPKLSEGDAVPAFELESDNEGTVSADSLKGSKYVLYFYPKDDTPGCTTEACDFRDNIARLTGYGYKVYGVSPDTVKSHEKFRGKYDLNFPLLADPDHEVAEAFGIWREKKNYGKTYTGLVRSTFLIDEEGKLEKIYDNVRAKGHVERIVRELGE